MEAPKNMVNSKFVLKDKLIIFEKIAVSDEKTVLFLGLHK